MSDLYGGGIYLTSQNDLPPVWDMDIDSSGDIKTIEGEDELQKDVAFSTAVRIGPEIGNVIKPIVLNRIRARVKDALDDDERIQRIEFVDVTETTNDSVEVTAVVRANNQRTEFVFEVDN